MYSNIQRYTILLNGFNHSINLNHKPSHEISHSFFKPLSHSLTIANKNTNSQPNLYIPHLIIQNSNPKMNHLLSKANKTNHCLKDKSIERYHFFKKSSKFKTTLSNNSKTFIPIISLKKPIQKEDKVLMNNESNFTYYTNSLKKNKPSNFSIDNRHLLKQYSLSRLNQFNDNNENKNLNLNENMLFSQKNQSSSSLLKISMIKHQEPFTDDKFYHQKSNIAESAGNAKGFGELLKKERELNHEYYWKKKKIMLQSYDKQRKRRHCINTHKFNTIDQVKQQNSNAVAINQKKLQRQIKLYSNKSHQSLINLRNRMCCIIDDKIEAINSQFEQIEKKRIVNQ